MPLFLQMSSNLVIMSWGKLHRGRANFIKEARLVWLVWKPPDLPVLFNLQIDNHFSVENIAQKPYKIWIPKFEFSFFLGEYHLNNSIIKAHLLLVYSLGSHRIAWTHLKLDLRETLSTTSWEYGFCTNTTILSKTFLLLRYLTSYPLRSELVDSVSYSRSTTHCHNLF